MRPLVLCNDGRCCSRVETRLGTPCCQLSGACMSVRVVGVGACAQESLGAMGIDTSLAVERARSESRGRKRARSVSAARSDVSGDVDMEDAQPKKRVHSSKSRSAISHTNVTTAPIDFRIRHPCAAQHLACMWMLAGAYWYVCVRWITSQVHVARQVTVSGGAQG